MEQGSPARLSSRILEEEFELNERKFYRTTFFDISCIRCENGYYNFTKIAQDNGKRDINEIVRLSTWKRKVEAFKRNYLFSLENNEFILRISCPAESVGELYKEISDDMLSFTVQTRDEKLLDLNGTYMPEDLLHFFCELVNDDYAVRISYLITLIHRETHLRNITLEQKIEEQAALVESLKTRLHNCNRGFNHERPGSILMLKQKYNVSKHEAIQRAIERKRALTGVDESQGELFRVRFSQLKQSNYDASKRNRDIKKGKEVIETRQILNVYNPLDIQRLFNHYANQGMLDGISFVSRNYVIGSFEAIEKAIRDISDFVLVASTPLSKDEAIRISVDFASRAKIPRHQIRSKLFEWFCAYKYCFKPFNREITERIGLYKNDVAMDLIDIRNKRIGQCKYYYKNKLPYSSLDTYLDACDSIMNYTAYLFINDECEVDEEIEEEISWELVRVPTNEFEEFLNEVDTQLKEQSTSTSLVSNSLSNRASDEEIVLLKSIIGLSQMNKDELLSRFNKLNKSDWSIVQLYNAFNDHIIHKHGSYVDGFGNIELKHDEEYIKIMKEWIMNYIAGNMLSRGCVIAETMLTDFNFYFKRFDTLPTLRKRFAECMIEFEYASKSINGKYAGCFIFKHDTTIEQDFIREMLKGRYMAKQELVDAFNEHFKTHYNINAFTREFRDLFEINENGNLKHIRNNGKTIHVYSLKRDIDEERRFIIETLKNEPLPRDEFISIFNSHFQSYYKPTEFISRFHDLFVFTGSKPKPHLKRMTFEKGNPVQVCMLREEILNSFR